MERVYNTEVFEIFKDISCRMKTGAIMHFDMANLFDFMDLHGFKRMHEYQFLKESSELRSLHRYYINHVNRMIKEKDLRNVDVIPSVMYSEERFNVNGNEIKEYVEKAMNIWKDWEFESKCGYGNYYTKLCEMKDIALADKVKQLICDVDMELKRVDRLAIELKQIDYDVASIHLMQDKLHEEYKEKTKNIGIDIC